jgi:hypothetical protein
VCRGPEFVAPKSVRQEAEIPLLLWRRSIVPTISNRTPRIPSSATCRLSPPRGEPDETLDSKSSFLHRKCEFDPLRRQALRCPFSSPCNRGSIFRDAEFRLIQPSTDRLFLSVLVLVQFCLSAKPAQISPDFAIKIRPFLQPPELQAGTCSPVL